jgi:hypothetical protein
VKLDNTIKELPKQLSEEVEENGMVFTLLFLQLFINLILLIKDALMFREFTLFSFYYHN